MIYIKALIVAACVALAIIFMVQNNTELSEPLRIRLNLYFTQFESTPFATYLVVMLSFFVGLFVASVLGLADRFRMRGVIRRLKKDVTGLQKELTSLRNLPITSEPMATDPLATEPLNGETAALPGNEAKPENGKPAEETKLLGQAQDTPAAQAEPAEAEAEDKDGSKDKSKAKSADSQVTPEEKEALT